MGNDSPTDPAILGQFFRLTNGDYDERPVHQVAITQSFYISETEITREQFERFRPDHSEPGRYEPYVSGVSWCDAQAFCDWLTKKEHRTYRLPTEAEWEYSARAGTRTYFSSGSQLASPEAANRFGLRGVHTGPAEWVLDWHGLYSAEAQTDPVGPSSGFARVVRGGGIMGPRNREPVSGDLPYYRRSANRAGIAPSYRSALIGFRIVQAEMPTTMPTAPLPNFVQSFVRQSAIGVTTGPDPTQPWFRQRSVLPVPPEDATPEEIEAAGLPPRS